MFAFANSACCLVSMLPLLLIVLCRMFSHHVYLEVRTCGALEVAVITGKRLLTSVRSHVLLERVSSIAGIITLVTLKWSLSRMSEHVGLEVDSS